MHASTRILLLLVAILAILGGWWLLLANNAFIAAVIYGVLWAAVVLVVTIILMKIGAGFNRMRERRHRTPEPGSHPETALNELTRLRDGGLISPEEYEIKRAQIIERL